MTKSCLLKILKKILQFDYYKQPNSLGRKYQYNYYFAYQQNLNKVDENNIYFKVQYKSYDIQIIM